MIGLGFTLVPLLLAGVFAFLYFAVDKNKEEEAGKLPLKLLFILATLFFLIVAVGMQMSLAGFGAGSTAFSEVVSVANNTYFLTIFLIITAVSLIMLLILWNYFKWSTTLVKWNRKTHKME